MVLTLSPAYLDTLAAGKHQAVLRFADGTAETTIIITKPFPQTGDGASPLLWILCVCAGSAALLFLFRRRPPAER
jgi:LPXTG-motif cell wall-anchored protein